MLRCVIDRWGQAATGPSGQRRGAGGREESEAVRRARRRQAGPASTVPGGVV
jgi:hypothetical protein